MLRFFDSELLTVEDEVINLTPAKYNNVGASRASFALITVKDAVVSLSFNETPTQDLSHEYGPGSTFQITGYDNIVNAKFLQLTDVTAKIYVSYGN